MSQTLEYQKKIKEVEEELSLLSNWRFVIECNPAATRIFKNKQKELETLKKVLGL